MWKGQAGSTTRTDVCVVGQDFSCTLRGQFLCVSLHAVQPADMDVDARTPPHPPPPGCALPKRTSWLGGNGGHRTRVHVHELVDHPRRDSRTPLGADSDHGKPAHVRVCGRRGGRAGRGKSVVVRLYTVFCPLYLICLP